MRPVHPLCQPIGMLGPVTACMVLTDTGLEWHWRRAAHGPAGVPRYAGWQGGKGTSHAYLSSIAEL